jgi:hypothetical protein
MDGSHSYYVRVRHFGWRYPVVSGLALGLFYGLLICLPFGSLPSALGALAGCTIAIPLAARTERGRDRYARWVQKHGLSPPGDARGPL